MQPVIPWLQKVFGDGPDEIFMVFWHHYSGGGGNFTHSTQHGLFFNLADAIEYTAALIQTEKRSPDIAFEEVFPAIGVDPGKTHSEAVMGMLEDTDSKQICLVNKSGNLLFGSFPRWAADAANATACLHFEYETVEDIRANLRI